MSHFGTPNTKTNRTCPLRKIVAITTPSEVWASYGHAGADRWQDETLECGHVETHTKGMAKAGQRRRCIRCRDEGKPGIP